jgi:hypothetical protein
MVSASLSARRDRKSPRVRAVAALLALGLIVLAGEALGCPTCKDSLADGDAQAANLARGYFYSILIMLAMPFTLASSFGLYVWREMRRQGPAGEGRQGPPRDAGEGPRTHEP